MRPTYQQFVFADAPMYARAWLSVNAIDPHDIEGQFEKAMELAWRALVEEGGKVKSPRTILTEIGVNPDDYLPPAPPVPPMSRLHRDGRRLVNAEGVPFHVGGVSAFRLCEMVARGREAEAIAYLDWMQAEDVQWGRVFLAVRNMFDLPPQAGLEALPVVLELARQRGRYLEVVCRADLFKQDGTGTWPSYDWRRHVRQVGLLWDRFENFVVEIENEPNNPPWQRSGWEELQLLADELLDGGPYTLGASHGPDDESREFVSDGASWQNVHSDRTRGGWGNVRHTRECQVLSQEIKQYVVDDEPDRGFSPAQEFAKGAIARVGSFGDLWHDESGKHCRIPEGAALTRFKARQRGWRSVPTTFTGTFANFGWTPPNPESPVQAAVFLDEDARVYSSVTPTEAYVVLSHAQSPMFKAGWTATVVDHETFEASVWHCTR